MTWPLGLSRFIHGFSSFDEPSCGARAPDGKRLVETDRQARLLPAVIATLAAHLCGGRAGLGGLRARTAPHA